MNSTQTVDNVFLLILAISVGLLTGIVTTMIYFAIRYNSKRHPFSENIRDNLTLEIVWVVIPLIIVLAMFFYGWKGFRFMRTVPANAIQVKAYARMWQWSFEYENGRTDGTLVVPAGRPVKLLITSRDVLHSLFIPAFRIKEDAVPGMQTYLWFLPDREGEYDLFCSEYCGRGHSSMITKVKVVADDNFRVWLNKEGVMPAETGKAPMASLLQKKGCLSCHSADGTKKVGPTFKGLFGSSVEVITSGKERIVVADEEYLRRSLADPKADIVKGFPPIMPQMKDEISPDELSELVRKIQGLK